MADPNKAPAATADKAPTTPSESVRFGEVEIELGDARNRVKTWPPTRQTLRGHWLKNNLVSDERTEATEKLPDFPGIRIRLNQDRRTALIYDPLKLDKPALLVAEAAVKDSFGGNQTAMEPVSYEEMDDTDIKTWAYWMRRMVMNGDAKVTAGALPQLRDIAKLPGNTEMEQWNSSSRKNKFRETQDEHIDSLTRFVPGRVG